MWFYQRNVNHQEPIHAYIQNAILFTNHFTKYGYLCEEMTEVKKSNSSWLEVLLTLMKIGIEHWSHAFSCDTEGTAFTERC